MINNMERSIITARNSQKPAPKHLTIRDPNSDIKKWIWVYFFLLIFEGALRKWVLPGLAAPLLIVRDPIALFILFKALSKRLLPPNAIMATLMVIGVLGIITAVLIGHGNIIVALYGARIFLLHIPVVFVIGRVFNRQDVLKMGIVTIWITVGMTLLLALQFHSPQTAWVNKGVGGDENAGFRGALGFFRPSGTFSFTNGSTLFYSYAATFIFYFSIQNKEINRLILIAGILALIVSIPLSISRGLFFQVAVSLVFVIIAVARKPKYLARLIGAGFAFVIILIALSQASFFRTGLEAFTARFDSANQTEGGLQGVLLDRFLGGLIQSITSRTGIPFFGEGLGMGTKAGSMLLTGKASFLISEGEWGRVVGELGLLMGLIVIIARLAFVIKIASRAYKKLAKSDLLPWLLLSFGCINFAQGLWAQPTALGFSVIVGGLMLSSFNPGRQTSPILHHPRFK